MYRRNSYLAGHERRLEVGPLGHLETDFMRKIRDCRTISAAKMISWILLGSMLIAMNILLTPSFRVGVGKPSATLLQSMERATATRPRRFEGAMAASVNVNEERRGGFNDTKDLPTTDVLTSP